MAETGLALTGQEGFDDLASTYLTAPLVYTVPWGRYAMLVLLPFAIPLVGLPMRAPAPLFATLLTGAVILSAVSAFTRWPPKMAVRFDARGVAWRQRTVPWHRVAGVQSKGFQRRRSEPRRLVVQVDGEPPITVTDELTWTSPIRSLRNLAELIEAISAAARDRDDAADALQDRPRGTSA